MSGTQRFRLRSAGYKRDIVTPVEPGERFIDRQSGTDFVVVGEVVPAGDAASELPWSAENLRLCGCSRQQFVPKDVNDCPYCDRRIPAADASAPDSQAPESPVASDSVASDSQVTASPAPDVG